MLFRSVPRVAERAREQFLGIGRVPGEFGKVDLVVRSISPSVFEGLPCTLAGSLGDHGAGDAALRPGGGGEQGKGRVTGGYAHVSWVV